MTSYQGLPKLDGLSPGVSDGKAKRIQTVRRLGVVTELSNIVDELLPEMRDLYTDLIHFPAPALSGRRST